MVGSVSSMPPPGISHLLAIESLPVRWMRRMCGSGDSFSLLLVEASSGVARSALDVLTGMNENGGERVEKIQAPTTRM